MGELIMINSAATADLNVEIDAKPISNTERADNTTARGGAATTISIVYQKRIYKSRLILSDAVVFICLKRSYSPITASEQRPKYMFEAPTHILISGGGLLVGLAFGAVVWRAPFCFIGALSSAVVSDDDRGLQAVYLAMASAISFTQVLVSLDLIDID